MEPGGSGVGVVKSGCVISVSFTSIYSFVVESWLIELKLPKVRYYNVQILVHHDLSTDISRVFTFLLVVIDCNTPFI